MKNQNKPKINIGDRLRQEREKKGFSLEDVHNHLRIHPSVISRIEQNDFGSFPAPIYTRGFLKRYGELLNLNSQEILAEFENLKLGAKPPLVIPPKANLYKPTLSFVGLLEGLGQAFSSLKIKPPHRKWILILLVILAAIAMIPMFPASDGGDRMIPEAQVPLPPPVADNVINSPAQNNFPKIAKNVTLILTIKASRDAWLRIFSDGNNVYESILRPGQEKQWSAEDNFEIKMGRPAAVFLTLNDFALGSPEDGQAKHVRISRSGMVKFK
jgi:transcriptional regulator with XRE-family HTH domain